MYSLFVAVDLRASPIGLFVPVARRDVSAPDGNLANHPRRRRFSRVTQNHHFGVFCGASYRQDRLGDQAVWLHIETTGHANLRAAVRIDHETAITDHAIE